MTMGLTYTPGQGIVSDMRTETGTVAAIELRDKLASLGVSCDITPVDGGVSVTLFDREAHLLNDNLEQLMAHSLPVSDRQVKGQLSLPLNENVQLTLF